MYETTKHFSSSPIRFQDSVFKIWIWRSRTSCMLKLLLFTKTLDESSLLRKDFDKLENVTNRVRIATNQ